MKQANAEKPSLKNVSVLGAFSLSVGAAIGWGSFVVTSSSYLLKAGTAGMLIGLLIGMVLMGCVAYTYHFMVNRYPDSGGLHSYVFHVFGPDRAFLASWYLLLVHLAIIWANLTALPLFAKYLFGPIFQFGFHYTIGESHVYFGEILLTVGVLAIIAALSFLKKKASVRIVTIMTFAFLAAVLVVFIAAIIRHEGGLSSYEPAFAPGDHPIKEIYGVVAMTPWAFIGFESISNSAGDFKFSHKKTFGILMSAVIAVGLAYILLSFISASYAPEGNWYEYLSSNNPSEVIAPIETAFFALGHFGKWFFAATLLFIVLTSLITHTIAFTGLTTALSEAGILPSFFSKKNRWGNHIAPIGIIIATSAIVPFIGRAAIGWIVDVNTFGGTIVYAFVAASTMKIARREKKWAGFVTGLISIVASIAFVAAIIIPSFTGGDGGMASVSFIIFYLWGMLGFIYFRHILKKDHKHIFGHSSLVWLTFMITIIFSGIVWALGYLREVNADMHAHIDAMRENGTLTSETLSQAFATNFGQDVVAVIVLIGLTTVSQIVLFSVFRLIKAQAVEGQKELDLANEMATKDAMTGVRNKHAYSAKETLLNQAIDRRDDISFAIVVCDVNDLKYVNDNFGHEHGDVFIKKACEIICNTFQHSAVFRIGGDEFVAILEGADYENRDALLSGLRSISEEHNRNRGIVISCGMSVYNAKEDNAFARVFRRADQDMYQTKQSLKSTQAGKPIVA